MTKAARLASWQRVQANEYGLIEDAAAERISHLFPEWPTLGRAIAAQGLAVLCAAKGHGDKFALPDIRFRIPVPDPQKIICVGINYPARSDEYKDNAAAPARPSLFVRFPGSFVGHGQPIVRPAESKQFDYEGEIALVIGKGGRRIAEEDALGHIAALTLCNEGTVRDWLRHSKFNVTPGKNFERSGSMGPWLAPFESADQLRDIRLETRVNGEVRQSDRTGRMIFSPSRLLEYISTFTRLEPGDIIVSGTPTGAGARRKPPVWLKPGDVVEVEADGLGVLRNPVADDPGR